MSYGEKRKKMKEKWWEDECNEIEDLDRRGRSGLV